MKKIAAMMMAAGALGLGGCAVDSAEEFGPDEFASKDQAMGEWDYCRNDYDGTKEMRANLAVAMAKELGRLDPLLDLRIGTIPVYWGNMEAVVMSSAGLARCAARGKGDCPNTQAILALQNPGINGEPATNWQPLVPRNVLDGGAFSSKLVSGYRVQVAKQQQDPHYGGPLSQVELSYVGSQDYWFACGTHSKFAATGEWDKLKYRLMFFGYNPNNPYDFYSDASNAFLAFSANNGVVEMDPNVYMTGDGTTSSGTCTNACIVYSSSLNGSCCSCNGQTGTYRTLKRGTYACK